MKSNSTKRWLLVIEEEETVIRSLLGILTPAGYTLQITSSRAEAFAIVTDSLPDLILAAMYLPKAGIHGLDIIAELRRETALGNQRVIMMGVHPRGTDPVLDLDAREMYVTKPFHPKQMLAYADHILGIDRKNGERR